MVSGHRSGTLNSSKSLHPLVSEFHAFQQSHQIANEMNESLEDACVSKLIHVVAGRGDFTNSAWPCVVSEAVPRCK